MQSNPGADSIIRLESVEAKGGTLTITHSEEGPVARILTNAPFRLRADHPLNSVPPGILVIPFLGCLAPLSWLTDARVVAGEVDEAYVSALDAVRGAMRKAYPSLKFTGTIEARQVSTGSVWSPERYCLTYSGGIDSTASYLRNRARNPSLLMVRGTPDMRMSDVEYWHRTMERIAPALASVGADFHTIETNALDVVDADALKAQVKDDNISGWWENFAHGIFLTSTCAPFTYHSQTGRLLIASSFNFTSAKPWGSMPESDEQVRWGGLTVSHDSFDLTRFEKIRDYVAPFVRSRGGAFPIKLCLGKAERFECGKLNCGRCLKCITTALMMLECGIDPAKCEFDMSKFHPSRIRTGLENGYLKLEGAPNSWKYIMENAAPLKPELESSYSGINDLLRWAKSWDRKPRESQLRSYSKQLAPVDSRRRRIIRKILRSD
jgi:hypothetical protein